MEFTDAETEFVVFCLTLSVEHFTENAQVIREDPNPKLEPLARQFDDHADRATRLIKSLKDRPS